MAATHSARKRWKARHSPLAKLGAAVAAGLALLGLIFAVLLISLPASLWSLGLVLLAVACFTAAGVVALLTYGLLSLVYILEPSALVIRWLGQEFVVPYEGVDAIYGGNRLGTTTGPGRLNVRGYRVGAGWADGVGRITFFTTSEREADLTVIATQDAIVVLSPEQPAGFRRALIAHVQEDELSEQHYVSPGRRLSLEALVGRWAWIPLALAGLLLLLITGLLLDRFAALPAEVPLGFGANGEAQVGSKAQLWWIPAIGALVLFSNAALGVLLAAREALLARLLWLATPAIMMMLLISAIRLVG